jgi:putative membrane protein
MKSTILSVCIIVSSLLFACKPKPSSKLDSVEVANGINKSRIKRGVITPEEAVFLVNAADARMMDMEEGKNANKISLQEQVKKYGTLMVDDQTLMLMELKAISKTYRIILPSVISRDKKKALENLLTKRGKDFDEEFSKMITIDHERDIEEFKKASKFKNPKIKEFASRYLPMIEGHLEKIKAIKSTL